MKQKICGLLAMLLLLSGCGSSTPTDTSPMSEDEITQMYSDPDSFKEAHARAVRPCVQRARVR